jgi:hypothetical protein
MQANFTITLDQTMDFAEHWTSQGMFVPLGPVEIQFATDWANIVLVNFIQQAQTAAKALKARDAVETTGIGKALILEGVQ